MNPAAALVLYAAGASTGDWVAVTVAAASMVTAVATGWFGFRSAGRQSRAQQRTADLAAAADRNKLDLEGHKQLVADMRTHMDRMARELERVQVRQDRTEENLRAAQQYADQLRAWADTVERIVVAAGVAVPSLPPAPRATWLDRGRGAGGRPGWNDGN